MRHITTPNAAASQTEHPWRATLRTFIQAFIPAVALFILAVPPVVDIILDEVGKAGLELPGWAYAALTGLSVGTALIAAIVARIMAVPAVEKALRSIGLGAAPTEPDFGTWDGDEVEADVDDLAQEPTDEPTDLGVIDTIDPDDYRAEH